MIFLLAPWAIAVMVGNILGVNVVARAGPRAQAVILNDGVPAEYLDQEGKIKSWRGATPEDTSILRESVQKGWLDGYSTRAVQTEYPRFNRFTTKCLGDKLSNLRRDYRNQEEKRRDSKFLLLYLSIQFHSPTGTNTTTVFLHSFLTTKWSSAEAVVKVSTLMERRKLPLQVSQTNSKNDSATTSTTKLTTRATSSCRITCLG